MLQAHMSESDQECLDPSLMFLDTPYITTDRRGNKVAAGSWDPITLIESKWGRGGAEQGLSG